MKIFAFIFAIYTTALSLVPCNDVHSGQMNIPLTVQAAQEHHEDDNDRCSPFCQCNCCQGFVVITHLKQYTGAQFSSKEQFSFYVKRFPSKIAMDHWQPPRAG